MRDELDDVKLNFEILQSRIDALQSLANANKVCDPIEIYLNEIECVKLELADERRKSERLRSELDLLKEKVVKLGEYEQNCKINSKMANKNDFIFNESMLPKFISEAPKESLSMNAIISNENEIAQVLTQERSQCGKKDQDVPLQSSVNIQDNKMSFVSIRVDLPEVSEGVDETSLIKDPIIYNNKTDKTAQAVNSNYYEQHQQNFLPLLTNPDNETPMCNKANTINKLKSTNKLSTLNCINFLPLVEISNDNLCREYRSDNCIGGIQSYNNNIKGTGHQQNSWQPIKNRVNKTPTRDRVDKTNNLKSSNKPPILKWIGSLPLIEAPNDNTCREYGGDNRIGRGMRNIKNIKYSGGSVRQQSNWQPFFLRGRSNKFIPIQHSRNKPPTNMAPYSSHAEDWLNHLKLVRQMIGPDKENFA